MNIQEMKMSMHKKEQSERERVVRRDEERHQIFAKRKRRHWTTKRFNCWSAMPLHEIQSSVYGAGWRNKGRGHGIDWKVEFCNVHRFDRFQQNRSRPIVAKFLYENDRVSVLERTHKLKGSGFGINEQFPHAIEERRKQLYPIMKELRSQGNRTKLVKDRLYVNGRLHKVLDSRDEHHTGAPYIRQQRDAATHAQHITRSTGAEGRPGETVGRHERQTIHPTTAYSTVASTAFTGHSTGH